MNKISLSLILLLVVGLVGCKEALQGGEREATQKRTKVAKKDVAQQKKVETKELGLVGQKAPDFNLKTIDGKEISLSDFKGKTVVLEWFNPQCPFVVASHEKGGLIDTAQKHIDKGVVWLAVNSGGEGKQGFDATVNQEAHKKWKLSHPILRDDSGKVGKLYGATNTPQMVVIGADGNVAYRGAIDNSPDGEGASPQGGALRNYVDEALADIAAKRPVKTPTTKPYGCSVKYAS